MATTAKHANNDKRPANKQGRKSRLIACAYGFIAVGLVLKASQLLATLNQSFSYSHAFVTADVATAARSFLTNGLWTLRFVPINNNPPLGTERAAYLHWPPLTPILLSLWYKIFRISEVSTHAFSIVVAVFMGLALYMLARHALGRLGAAFALLTWACLPVTLQYIHLPSQQNLAVALLTFALFCALKALGEGSFSGRWRIAGLVSACLASAASWEAVFLGIGLVCAGMLARRRDILRLGVLYTIAGVGTAAAILALYVITYPFLIAETLHTILFRIGLASSYGTEHIDIHGMVRQLPFTNMVEFTCAKLLEMLGIVGVLAVAAALFNLLRGPAPNRRHPFAVAFIATTASWVIWYACFLNHVALHPFETIIAAPCVVLATAWWGLRAIEYLDARRLNKWELAILLAVPAIGFLPSAQQTCRALRGTSPAGERSEVEFGREIKRLTPSGSIVLTPDGSMIPVFYSARHVIRYISNVTMLPRLLPLIRKNFAGAPIYLAFSSDQARLFRSVLDDKRVTKTREGGVMVLNLTRFFASME